MSEIIHIQNLIIQIRNSDIYVIENKRPLYLNDIIKNACIHGHDKVLEWYLENNRFKNSTKNTNYACENGHVNILEWLKNSKYGLSLNKNSVLLAVKNGHYNIVKWILNYNKNYINGPRYEIMARACEYNRFEIIMLLKKFLNQKYILNKVVCVSFKFNRLNILLWVLKMFRVKFYVICNCVIEFCNKKNLKILYIIIDKYGFKKIIKSWTIRRKHKILRNLRFKSKNKYLKGYNKN
jgi:hypothetical protein